MQAHSRIYWITGLPRSGSTLLPALLLQTPRFHAGMTSPVVPRALFDVYGAEVGKQVIFGAILSTLFDHFSTMTFRNDTAGSAANAIVTQAT